MRLGSQIFVCLSPRHNVYHLGIGVGSIFKEIEKPFARQAAQKKRKFAHASNTCRVQTEQEKCASHSRNFSFSGKSLMYIG